MNAGIAATAMALSGVKARVKAAELRAIYRELGAFERTDRCDALDEARAR